MSLTMISKMAAKTDWQQGNFVNFGAILGKKAIISVIWACDISNESTWFVEYICIIINMYHDTTDDKKGVNTHLNR